MCTPTHSLDGVILDPVQIGAEAGDDCGILEIAGAGVRNVPRRESSEVRDGRVVLSGIAEERGPSVTLKQTTK